MKIVGINLKFDHLILLFPQVMIKKMKSPQAPMPNLCINENNEGEYLRD
jgi:hypothetical protein